MATERWMKMVEATEFYSDGLRVCRSADVVKLLARQHRAFVRMVKKCRQECIDGGKADTSVEGLGYWHVKEEACDDILAALAKQGGKK